MSDSVRPHRQRPTRLPCPWDSPGKNTGVGCHFLLQCMKVKSESEVAQSCPTPSDPMFHKPTRLLHPWDFPGKSTGVGCHCLLRSTMLHHLYSPLRFLRYPCDWKLFAMGAIFPHTLPFPQCHIMEFVQHTIFGMWLLPLKMMLLKFIHTRPYSSRSFLFITE